LPHPHLISTLLLSSNPFYSYCTFTDCTRTNGKFPSDPCFPYTLTRSVPPPLFTPSTGPFPRNPTHILEVLNYHHHSYKNLLLIMLPLHHPAAPRRSYQVGLSLFSHVYFCSPQLFLSQPGGWGGWGRGLLSGGACEGGGGISDHSCLQ
jgi:hypothetical protein